MSKLFKLKEWLTVPDAARHLSIAFGESVSEADVLQLALDGHLKLSVNFVNLAKASKGTIVHYSHADLDAAFAADEFPKELQLGELPPELEPKFRGIGDELRDRSMLHVLNKQFGDDGYLIFADEVETIGGVWDLPLIGGERLAVEHKCQSLTNGPAITLESLEGAFVETSDGRIWELKESLENNKYQRGSRAELEEWKRFIVENNVGEVEAAALLKSYDENRKKFIANQKSGPASKNYYPAGALPEDSFLVVRTEALRQFEQSINDESSNVEKLMTTTERNTLLIIIAALCRHLKIDYEERGAASQISRMTEVIAAPVTDDTIRKVLKKVSDALETRMK